MERTSQLGCLLAILWAAGAAAAPVEMAGLEFMTGSWGSEKDGRRTQEVWMSPGGNVMLGMHREIPGEGDVFFEYLRIEKTEEGVFYHASPMGRSPTAFKLVESAPRRAVFENPDHDFPQRITYWLDGGGSLCARIDGQENGRSRSTEWCWSPRPLDDATSSALEKRVR